MDQFSFTFSRNLLNFLHNNEMLKSQTATTNKEENYPGLKYLRL